MLFQKYLKSNKLWQSNLINSIHFILYNKKCYNNNKYLKKLENEMRYDYTKKEKWFK